MQLLHDYGLGLKVRSRLLSLVIMQLQTSLQSDLVKKNLKSKKNFNYFMISWPKRIKIDAKKFLILPKLFYHELAAIFC